MVLDTLIDIYRTNKPEGWAPLWLSASFAFVRSSTIKNMNLQSFTVLTHGITASGTGTRQMRDAKLWMMLKSHGTRRSLHLYSEMVVCGLPRSSEQWCLCLCVCACAVDISPHVGSVIRAWLCSGGMVNTRAFITVELGARRTLTSLGTMSVNHYLYMYSRDSTWH